MSSTIRRLIVATLLSSVPANVIFITPALATGTACVAGKSGNGHVTVASGQPTFASHRARPATSGSRRALALARNHSVPLVPYCLGLLNIQCACACLCSDST